MTRDDLERKAREIRDWYHSTRLAGGPTLEEKIVAALIEVREAGRVGGLEEAAGVADAKAMEYRDRAGGVWSAANQMLNDDASVLERAAEKIRELKAKGST